MQNELSLVFIILLLASVCSLLLGFYAYATAKNKPAVKAYTVLTISASIYSFGYAFEIMSNTLPEILFWLNIQYLAIPIIPAIWLLMILDLLGLDRFLKRKLHLAIFVIPLFTYIFYFSNDLHQFFYTSVALKENYYFLQIETFKGPWYWVHITYYFFSMIFGSFLLLRGWARTGSSYRRQRLLLIIGILIPLIGEIIYIGGYSPLDLDLAPILLSFAIPFHALALLNYRMFDLVPIAHEKVFSSMQDGVIILDDKNRIVDFNGAATKIFAELQLKDIGKKVDVVLRVYDKLIEQVASTAPDEEIEVGSAPGLSYIQSRLSMIREKNGLLIGKTLLLSDITDQKKAISLLAEQQKLLEDNNQELAMANRLKSELLANFSHELRTPLNAIIGYSDILQQDKPNLMVDAIIENSHKLLALINDVMEMSKIESGSIVVGDMMTVSVAHIFKDIEVRYGKKINAKNLDFIVTYPSPTEQINCDIMQLERVICKIIDNAIKFTDSGSISLFMESNQLSTDIIIKDTGIGIESKNLNKIFDKFYLVDSSYSRSQDGTGLGLPIANAIVKQMGGELSVLSEGLGYGTSVKISLSK
ncbi:PAS domain-containing protein [Heliorestis acidaminivorans]|uniref:histidine kinase n=1 Tax=Heliorestis acidaminivorans TaxID=553427 RepID=A0A6I0F3H2_9FIRM|nr:histidine kinase N-terminal 7TM domain-containing protein [Heliorestis acidaminivorans]KAB2954290.1 PAS domain-containing protein [Heliorestis acidaminivorans]